MENSEFKLEQQNPKKEELLENERASLEQISALQNAIENSEIVSELEDIIYESENQSLISEYNKLRFEYLKANNTFIDGDEEKIFDLELEKYTDVDDNGFLIDDTGQKTENRITNHDRRELDADFIATVKNRLLQVV